MTSSALMYSSASWWGSSSKKDNSVCHKLLCRLSQSPSLLISGSGSGPQPEALAQSLAHFAFPLVMRRSIGHFRVPENLTFKPRLSAKPLLWKGAPVDCKRCICRYTCRLQNSPYFCVFKYTRAVKQKVWNEAENRERDWGETLKIRFFLSPHTWGSRGSRA